MLFQQRAFPMFQWLLGLLMLAVVAGRIGRAADADAPKRPNIVLILGDDTGLPWLSCYGADSFQTPNIDALAARGMRFERCYALPFCGPTRCQLITGRYPFRTGGIGNGASARVAASNERPIAKLLRDAGYATGMCGKWAQMTGNLNDWGFDEYITSDSPGGYFWEKSYVKNGQHVTHDHEIYYPDVCHEFAMDFFRRHREQPFFFYYSSHLTHAPILRTPDSKPGGPEGASDEAYFDDNVAYLDKQVGRIVAELERLDLSERTLILFTGDNGSTRGHKPTAGLRGRRVLGGKGSMLEGGSRVPLIACWSGVTVAGATCEDMVDFSDFHATLRDLAGIREPQDFPLDGISFAPRLRGADARPREWAFVQLQGDWYVCDKQWKLTRDGDLFDLRDAPFAEHEVPKDTQDPKAREGRALLQRALDELNPAGGFTGPRGNATRKTETARRKAAKATKEKRNQP